ncbi:MAG TPA: sigma-70 family RNA polymerase sigma factor, partial [Candidatus Saccharimonadales bacterium]|nr:sigma-70 family RNA polymerase sigma factor [Candidatus Saccharimonadales bacterium]
MQHDTEVAFTELVTRHTNLVYSAALRLMNSPDLAAEITQSVFIGLARGARTLSPRLAADASLAGWLCRSARNIACNARRNEFRQHSRERQAMEDLNAAPETTLDWERLRPVLDRAMAQLSEPDYDALVMRYFNNQDLRSVGRALGVSDDTAQKRVSRALDKLREQLAQHGISSPAAAIAVVLSANAVQAAPIGLAAAISNAALLAGTAFATTTTATIVKTIAMTTLQKALLTITIAAVASAGVFEARQAAVLRYQVQALQKQQNPLIEQLAIEQNLNQKLSNKLARATDSQALSKAQFNDLMRLRGQIGVARADSRELAKLKSKLAQSGGLIPDALTNAIASGLEMAEKWKMKDAKARLARMTKALNLTEDQAQAIDEMMQTKIKEGTQMTMDLMTGKSTADQYQAVAKIQSSQDAEIKALLTPGQMDAYPQYLQTEKITAATTSANNDAGQIANDFSLSKDQQQQIQTSFYQLNLNAPANGLSQEATADAKTSTDFADAAIELQKS